MSENIKIEHIGRVEGSGGVTVDIKDGVVQDVKLEIFEGSRFFEFLIVGKSYDEIPGIVCRICAICSSSHMLTSLAAIENAFGINVSKQTKLLRELLHCGEMIESHALHLFCLVAPDHFGFTSVIALAQKYPDIAKMGLSLKKLGNTIQELIGGGRPVHPINTKISGFGKLPSEIELLTIKDGLKKAIDSGLKTVKFFSELEVFPIIDAPEHLTALKPEKEKFSFHGESISISDGVELKIDEYKKLCNEAVLKQSRAKHTTYKGKPFMVGSLSRLMLFGDMFYGESKEAMNIAKFTKEHTNPLYNNLAQAVELVYSIQRSMEIIDEIIKDGIKDEPAPKIKLKKCKGTGALEAPRGTLYHHYEFDENGKCVSCDIITPTAINCANIEKDLKVAAENLLKNKTEVKEMELKLEMVIRTYDPCISCAVHMIKINNL
ncbi:MAG: Ni/Fe hydrogenase subunit alpha [Elusimicrobiota bacterium]